MKIGLFGGSFNPIHSGHLKIGLLAKKQFNLNEIWFIPTNIHPFKGKVNHINDNDRLRMIELAIEDYRDFKINTVEIDLNLNFTYDVVNHLKKSYPLYTFYIIIGSDLLSDFDNWKNSNELLDNNNILLFNRGESMKFNHSNITFINNDLINISSTMIREKLSNKLDIKTLLPKSVFNYIMEKKLYQNG